MTLTTAAVDKYPGLAERWMRITGADYGVYVLGSGCAFRRCVADGNLYAGFSLNANDTLIENCVASNNAHDDHGTGIDAYNGSVTVRNCTISSNGRAGLSLFYATVTLENNIICADGQDDHALLVRWCSVNVCDYNDLYAVNGAYVCEFNGTNCPTLNSWRPASGFDAHSLSLHPQFVDPANGDFHLAPTSPCIDTGDPTMQDPDGSRIDLGAYGGTEQSSPTPAGRALWLYAPIGGENFLDQAVPVTIRWTAPGSGWQPGDTVRFAYSADSGATWTDIPGTAEAALGTYDWDISGLTPGARYHVAVICVQDESLSAASPFDFRLGRDIRFYVNDSSTTTDEWCTVPGDDSNHGTDPDHPKASVQAILNTYDLEPGDAVRIDTGTYDLSADIAVSMADQGSAEAQVTFEASPYGVTIDRGSTEGGAGWLIEGSYVTLTTAESSKYPAIPQRWMRITGAFHAVMVYGEGCKLSRLEANGNEYTGFHIEAQDCLLESCVAANTTDSDSGTGIAVLYGSVTVRNCTVSGSGRTGLSAYVATVSLLNNVICADGQDKYGLVVNWCSVTACDYNDVYATNGAYLGRFNEVNCRTLNNWRLTSGFDANSLSLDPQFVDPANGDFHLGPTSPCIDTGDPTMQDPDGSRIDMGAYGGTEQSSPTPAGRELWVYAPIGGENFLDLSVPVKVRWTSVGTGWQAGDTVRFAYSSDSGSTWTDVPGTANPASGDYDWDISGLTPGARYRVAVICVQDESVSAASPLEFRLGEDILFYVNDVSTTTDEWCTAPGDDSNHGADPDHPKASVQAILDSYDLEPGDTVRIDTGTYLLSANIVVSDADQGSDTSPVTFEASPYGVILSRNGEESWESIVWQIDGGFVTLATATSDRYPGVAQRWMKVTGAATGIRVYGTGCALSRCEADGNRYSGFSIAAESARLENCIAANATDEYDGTGITIESRNVTVRNCTVAGNRRGVRTLWNTNTTLLNNIICADGPDSFGVLSWVGFNLSDYNDFSVTNGAYVGQLQNVNYPTLSAWQAATGRDANSLSLDPQFVDAANGDFHLGFTSPCIDTGDPTMQDPDGSRIDMGAFGGTEQAVTRQFISVSGAKSATSGTPLNVEDAIVTAAFDDCFYLEAKDRSSGIRVESSDSLLQVGDTAFVSGLTMVDSNGEKCLVPNFIMRTGIGSIGPVGMTHKTLGGGDWQFDPATGTGQQGIFGSFGSNNVGLLTRVWGRVTACGRQDWFYLDDGSGVQDGTGTIGVYVEAPGLLVPSRGSLVSVTGISSCEFYQGNLVNVLLPRTQDDIIILEQLAGVIQSLEPLETPSPRHLAR